MGVGEIFESVRPANISKTGRGKVVFPYTPLQTNNMKAE